MSDKLPSRPVCVGFHPMTYINRTPLTSLTPVGSLGGANAPWKLSVQLRQVIEELRILETRPYSSMQKVAELIWHLVEAEAVLLFAVVRGILDNMSVSQSP